MTLGKTGVERNKIKDDITESHPIGWFFVVLDNFGLYVV
jgi:hypothetical protein